ncbi:MAG TPA: porin family protein [Methylovirgula sp.]|jgi:opacity protein-like surface antigen
MARSSGSLQASILAGALATGFAGTAFAADLPALPAPPMIEQPAPQQFSGWYLRGDVGYGFEQVSNFNSSVAGTTPGFQYGGSAVDGGMIVDAGFGYQVNNWFRGDITGEYRTPNNYSAFETYTNGGVRNGDAYRAQLRNEVVLANGYIDLGTWYGITPFVGAGVGAAFVQFHNLQDFGTGPGNFGGFGVAPDANLVNFAWAATAGLDYTISPNWKFEVSYRYLDMGKVASNGIVCTVTCTHEVQSFRLASQDVRVGLRYMFAEAPPAPPPLITKY